MPKSSPVKNPPVVARLRDGAVRLDLRTVPEGAEADLVEAVGRAWRSAVG